MEDVTNNSLMNDRASWVVDREAKIEGGSGLRILLEAWLFIYRHDVGLLYLLIPERRVHQSFVGYRCRVYLRERVFYSSEDPS